MKNFSLAALAIFALLGAFVHLAMGETVFLKDSQVRLTKDSPLLFKSEEARIGKAGETFTVIQHNTATKRVFVLATDAAGKQVALNVADDAVEFAAFDVASLRAVLLPLAEKGDVTKVTAAIEAAVAKAPNDPRLQQYRTTALAAKAAQDRVSAAAKNTEQVKQRVAELSKNAWAARNNLVDPQGGFARSQQMKTEAEQITAVVNKESEQAKSELESAKRNLAEALNRPVVDAPAPIITSVAVATASTTPATPPDKTKSKEQAVKATEQSPYEQAAKGKVPLAFDKLPEAVAVAASGGQFEEGVSYRFIGPVAQMTEHALAVDNLVTQQPLGVLVFGDSKKVGNVSVAKGTMIQAVIRFKAVKDIPLLNGAVQHMPVFDCMGFGPVGGEFIDTSFATDANAFPRLGESPEQIEQRYGKPTSSDSVGEFTRNNYLIKGYKVIIAFSEKKAAIVIIGKSGMTEDDAMGIMKTLRDNDIIQPESPGTHHVISSDKNDLEVGWTWRTDNPGFKQNAAYSPREAVLVFFADGHFWVDFLRAAIPVSPKQR